MGAPKTISNRREKLIAKDAANKPGGLDFETIHTLGGEEFKGLWLSANNAASDLILGSPNPEREKTLISHTILKVLRRLRREGDIP